MAKSTRAARTSSGGAKSKKSAKRASGGKVHVGVHGLARVLHTIRKQPKMRKAFERHMAGTPTIALDAAVADKLREFAKGKIRGFHDDCDCDPTTDPFCICF